jgi:integrase
MPRPAGSKSTPSYCHHKASDRGYATIDGKPVYFGPYDAPESRAKYHRLISEYLANGSKAPEPAKVAGPANASVTMVLLAFWKEAKARYVHPDGTPTGEADNYRLAIRALRLMYGDTPAADFGPKRLKLFRAHVLKDREEPDPETGEPVKRAGWSRTYTNRQVKRVQQMFRWGASEEMIPGSVPVALDTVDGIRRGANGARETEPVRPVTDAAVDATLPFLPPAVKAMVQLQRLTGARGGELFKLRTCDVDTSGPVWTHTPKQHKTQHHGHGRIIRFGPKAQAILAAFFRPDLQAPLFQPAESVEWRNAQQRAKRNPKTPITPSQRARMERAKGRERKTPFQPHYTKRAYAHAIARACRRAFPPPTELTAGLDEQVATAAVKEWHKAHNWHAHQVRHTAATKFRREGGFEAAKILLGHTTDSMTELYAERDDAKGNEVIQRVG